MSRDHDWKSDSDGYWSHTLGEVAHNYKYAGSLTHTYIYIYIYVYSPRPVNFGTESMKVGNRQVGTSTTRSTYYFYDAGQKVDSRDPGSPQPEVDGGNDMNCSKLVDNTLNYQMVYHTNTSDSQEETAENGPPHSCQYPQPSPILESSIVDSLLLPNSPHPGVSR